MRTLENQHERWDAVRAALRESGVVRAVDGDEKPPPGLATRIVTRVAADGRADAVGVALWRRWCVGGAAVAVLALGIGFLAVPDGHRDTQFMPVPELESLKEMTQ